MYSCFVVLWQMVIFGFSSQTADASSDLSGGFTKKILAFIFDGLSELRLEQMAEQLSFIVRKSAHFSIYFILGVLMFLAISKNKRFIDKLTKVKIRYSVLFCFLYSVSDEIHQFFVPGRALRIFDVFVDGLGSVCGIFTVYLLFKKFKSSK